MADLGNVVFVGVIFISIFGMVSQIGVWYMQSPLSQLEPEFAEWLVSVSLDSHAKHFLKHGALDLHTAVEVPALPAEPSVSLQEQEAMAAALYKLKERLILQHFLTTSDGVTAAEINRLSMMGAHSLGAMVRLVEAFPQDFPPDAHAPLLAAILLLPRSDRGLEEEGERVWWEVAGLRNLPSAARKRAYTVAAAAVLLACCSAVLVTTTAALLYQLGIVTDPEKKKSSSNLSCTCEENKSVLDYLYTITLQNTASQELASGSQYLDLLSSVNISSYFNSIESRPTSATNQTISPAVPNQPNHRSSSVERSTIKSVSPTCPQHNPKPRKENLLLSLNYILYHIAETTLSCLGLCRLTLEILRSVWYGFCESVWLDMTRSGVVVNRGHLGCTFKPGGFLQLFTGKYLHPKKCITTFNWKEPAIVGNTVSFTVQFFQRNGRPYPVSDADAVLVEIALGIHKVSVVTEVGGSGAGEEHSVRCHFTARQAGDYKIGVMVGQTDLRGSPFKKTFRPGPPSPQNTTLVSHSSTIVCVAQQQHTLLLEPRDSYHNLCLFQPGEEQPQAYTLAVTQVSGEGSDSVECGSIVTYDTASRRYVLHFLLQRPGCYHATLAYHGDTLPAGSFSIIVLEEEDSVRVRKFVSRRQLDGLEALMVPTLSSTPGGARSPYNKQKKVYCYITPKQLILKEYLFKFIPMRICTFRLCPSTKLDFTNKNCQSGQQFLTIDDGCQPPVTLISKDRNVIAATFAQFMLKNIGGSETFKDKQDHFYHEVRKLHMRRTHDRLAILISREKLLESSMKVTKNFTITDWCKSFEVHFHGEEGLDWGGLGREWVELLCMELFDDVKGNLFTSFNESIAQSLVHPNPSRSSHYKLKHYEFAGRLVGKCLYESALGSKYHQTVRARFTRSFLAQVIGLRVHYMHFAQDDPELFQGKVQYLLDHGTDLLEEPLYFTDQVVAANGTLTTVELECGGSSRKVENSNKLQYLDALAQFRLAGRVHAETQAFLAGLNEIIPDNLLCIFDENELELLMCGTEQYSIADLKAHHVVAGCTPDFKRVLYWFWTAIANFTEEEMARLLQFSTGCSRLPPGGFSQLSPILQLTPAHTHNSLPTAHTCFNQLCLPDHDTYEQFEKCLLIAIKEGGEGFGLV